MRSHLSMVVGLVALAGAALAFANAAQAYPTSCLIRTYYSSAEMTQVVGIRSNCPGARSWGRTTRFVEAERVDLSPPGPAGGGSGPGRLPCEFQQGKVIEVACPNTPIARP